MPGMDDNCVGRVGIRRKGALRRALLCATVSAALVAGALTARAEEPPIKLGLLLTYVGPTAIFARYEDKGARMKIDEVNAAGGINGRKIELTNYDTEG